MGTVNRTVFGCPSCGARVSGQELACPRCGVVFTGETKFECPFCGEMVARDSNVCPSCGIDLRLPEEKPVEATLDELFDQIIDSEKQKAHVGGKRFGCPNCSFLLAGTEDKCPNCGHEFVKVNQVECPICGALIPSTSKKCPECDRALVSLDDLADFIRDDAEEPAAGAKAEEVYFPELEPERVVGKEGAEPEEEELPPPPADEPAMAVCPVCGKISEADALTCPYCKTEFEPFDESEGAEQPEEGIHAADEAALKLDSLLEETAKDHLSEPRRLKPSKAATTKIPTSTERDAAGRLGKVNGTGFVNGRRAGPGSGATNGTGLVNGAGAINGVGAVNGVSLVNGRGASNGLGLTRRQHPTTTRRILMQWRVLAVLIALMMVVPAFFLMSSFGPKDENPIDGDFDEWASVQSYPAQQSSSSTSINVQEWSAVFVGDEFLYYIRTESDIMAGPIVESFCMFVDADGSASTGYSVGMMGAEYRVILEGWNGTLMASSVSHYGPTDDRYDWNHWMSAGTSEAVVSGSEMEGRAMLDDVSSVNPTVILISKDEAENLCFSAPVPIGGTLLVVDQSTVQETAESGVVGLETDVQLLRVTLSALGGTGTVTTMTPVTTGCELVSPLTNVHIDLGSPVTYDFRVDTSSGSATQFISAGITEEGVESDFDCVLVLGAGARAYLIEPPANVTIDGAFADWTGRTSLDTDFIPVQSASIDIQETGASNSSESAFFFVSVKGEMCCGAYVPRLCAKPVPGSGGVYIPTRKTAEDLTRIYIDSDGAASTGLVMSHLSEVIGADRMIEVRGLFGRITSSVMFQYEAGEWTATDAQVAAENDEKRLEVGVGLTDLGSGDALGFIFETTSWNGKSDLASFDPEALNVHSLSGGAQGSRAWPVETSVTPTFATSMSYQRKLFYDGTNFWSFYFDGSDTVHRYSTDGGETWADAGAVFTNSDVRYASIWYDSSNNLVYAVGDTSSASTNVYVQRGSVSPSSHAITWATSDSTCSVSANSEASKMAFISKDASGYIWILGTDKTSSSPARWDMTAFKSSSTDSISSWSSTGGMLTTDRNDAYLYGTILPAGSGSDMWAVYNYDMRLAARQYTSGAWGSETVVYNGAGGASNFIQVAPASALVDSDGVVHVIYGDSTKDTSQNSKPHIYYTYNTGSGWTAAIALDNVGDSVGNKCPTVSLDAATGDLYAFWIQMDNNNIVCKKNISGTWGFVDLGTQSSDAKSHLTSVYSASGQNSICYMWTQNTTSPIDVMFDRIPEFDGLLLPVGFMIFAVVLLMRTKGRGSRKP